MDLPKFLRCTSSLAKWLSNLYNSHIKMRKSECETGLAKMKMCDLFILNMSNFFMNNLLGT